MNANSSKLLELITQESQRAIRLSQRLLKVSTLNGSEISKVVIPTDRGIYLWRLKNSERIAYVGIASENFGLRQRIHGQDILPIYQKSVFRIRVSSEYRLDLGQACVNFIIENFSLSYLPCPDESPVTLKLAQLLLIAACRPKYNS